MYSIIDFVDMARDRVRMAAYTEALRRSVAPGCVVMDIGAGTGIMSLISCQLGAGRVIAVDFNDAIHVAREMAQANGLADRIEFLQVNSTDLALAERVDVIVSDLRGQLPLYGQHIPSIIHARENLLAPGGILIPKQDALWAAVIEAESLYNDHVQPEIDGDFGLNLQGTRNYATNTIAYGIRVTREQMLVSPAQWATLDYLTVESPDVNGHIEWRVERAGVGHGIIVWFDATLIDGVGFSNAPGEPIGCYPPAFLPWTQPVSLKVGDRIVVQLDAKLLGSDYIWRWNSSVMRDGQSTTKFSQSNFFSIPVAASSSRLQMRDAAYVPVPNQNAAVERWILELIDGRRTLSDIAASIRERFPERFDDDFKAQSYVGDVVEKYAK